MKTQRFISIDYDLNQKLAKEENASALINSLVKNHYEGEDLRRMSKEQLTKLLQAVEAKEKLEAEIEAIKNEQG